MFNNYPKSLKPLPSEYKKIYTKHYLENRHGKTSISKAAKYMESWMHRKVANDISDVTKKSTLELGAGTLNHLPYEPEHTYDIVEPYQELLMSAQHNHRIRNVYKDITEIPNKNAYNRIISIAVLEHLLDLPGVVARCALLLTKDGNFRAGIPNEGTILWKLGYKLTTGLEFKRRYKLDYNVLMQYEHVNSAAEIETVLKYFFKNVKCSVFGISKKMAFYRFYDCKNTNTDRCISYLNQLNN